MIEVKNAVILAAGVASRFVPLSLEQPKGLYVVRGEALIERQIRQLIEAGITDITLVLGYKAEMFLYLKEKYGVKTVYNPEYLKKNNICSLQYAKDVIGDTYICSCDDYFVENPFCRQEERTFYAGITVEYKNNEMYVGLDSDSRIVRMEKGCSDGKIIIGHSFWAQDFADKFFEIADEASKTGKYDKNFWEYLVRENLNVLPPMYFKEYPKENIVEFDFFEELRKFDPSYVKDATSKILKNITSVFNCSEADIVDFRKVSEGLTNSSFVFQIHGTDYIYRHPGEGTEKIIYRSNEKNSLLLAKEFGFDPTFLFMDSNEGWKISRFVKSFREPEYDSKQDSSKVIEVLQRLHKVNAVPTYGLEPWPEALRIESILRSNDPDCFKEYEELKKGVGELYEKTLGDGVQHCFCHGDTYKHNWMIEPDGKVILIDWEYAGYADPGVDVGYYIIDADYDLDNARAFIREYLADNYSPKFEFHFMAYSAIIAYYWFVWALYREFCGANMGDSLGLWKRSAQKFVDYLITD